MRIGVFGGSFDPIHFGHLLVAEQCREQAKLDKVLFVPAAQSPLKESSPTASDRQRIDMVSLAIAGHSSFEISTIEIDRGDKSYTVETLTQLKKERPDDQLFLIIGQDSLQTFDRWKEPKKICELATPLVVARPDSENTESVDLNLLKPFTSDSMFEELTSLAIAARLIDISSTDIRRRIGDGNSIRFLTTRSVEKYIETAKLYQVK